MGEMKDMVVQYHKDLYNQVDSCNHWPRFQFKRVVSQDGKEWLSRDIEFAELEYAVLNSPRDEAPGPDGFNTEFYIFNWSTVKRDVWAAVDGFFRYGTLVPRFNRAFISPIKKVDNACESKNFRPIALCNTLYKFISKILANRLKVLLPKLVSLNQSALIDEQSITENIILSHELVRTFNRKNGPRRACVKLDINKAYDSINRPFIMHVMRCFQFPDRWMTWMEGCMASTTLSMCINGNANGFFSTSNGDPISPYLFALAMEVFSEMLEDGIHQCVWSSFKDGGTPIISHLLFADDILVFAKATNSSLAGLKSIFQQFETWSGMKISKGKSSLFLSKSVDRGGIRRQRLGIPLGSLPIKYLGVPLSSSLNSIALFHGMVDRVRSKFDGWTNELLTQSDKVELINSVLMGQVQYWCMCFKIPLGIIKLIERSFRSFLWGDAKCHVSWRYVCKPIEEGGLGIRHIKDIAKTCRIKRAWDFCHNPRSLWAGWMKQKYMRQSSFFEVNLKRRRCSAIWNGMLNVREELAACTCRLDGRITWSLNSASEFIFKDVWDLVCDRHAVVPWHDLVWNQLVPPAWSFTTWKLFHNRLATKDLVSSYKPDIDPQCLMCLSAMEDMPHLMFDCTFANQFWQRSSRNQNLGVLMILSTVGRSPNPGGGASLQNCWFVEWCKQYG